ncbi:hypothetical protein JX265_008456 [Neoarthrinium moseri]|uniref:Deacetylase sirtuin-type domain-containing protein n=1 Tax=Neoarthrinium moseri TaxID=1658444 RepID=A0A9P9WI89_9PEZI|nr:hypothetical protein JX265_008456 [Neoarthrinium moseri]
MGNENSTVLDEDTPPQTLDNRDLRSVAKLIKHGRIKRIVVMTGAGISTAAGIPDFRSPETGLYHNLARLNLPFAEAVFDIDYFQEHPEPFYILAKELYPGKFHPTISHVFISMLAEKSLLHKLFTQNIDCLERAAGVPDSHIVEAHGSFATQRCIECKTSYPDTQMRQHVEKGEPPRCITGCGGLVKPDIVFFGESLPPSFYENRAIPAQSDLLLVLGTSLTVHPFASLPGMAMERTPRVLFNKERVGDLGTRADDVLCLMDCDSGIRKLAAELGWSDELERKWRDTVGELEAKRQLAQIQEPLEERQAKESVEERKVKWQQVWEEDEVDELTRAVEDKLELSQEPGTDIGTNEGAQIQNQETEKGTEGPAKGIDEVSAKGTEESPAKDQGGKEVQDASDGPKGGGTGTNQDVVPRESERSTDVATSKPSGVDGQPAVESHETASYSKPVVTKGDAEEEKPAGEEAKAGSVL